VAGDSEVSWTGISSVEDRLWVKKRQNVLACLKGVRREWVGGETSTKQKYF
jgi:hypothetical protein